VASGSAFSFPPAAERGEGTTKPSPTDVLFFRRSSSSSLTRRSGVATRDSTSRKPVAVLRHLSERRTSSSRTVSPHRCGLGESVTS